VIFGARRKKHDWIQTSGSFNTKDRALWRREEEKWRELGSTSRGQIGERMGKEVDARRDQEGHKTTQCEEARIKPCSYDLFSYRGDEDSGHVEDQEAQQRNAT
jgi:hypothetical protein